jgi:hypothetical protein
MAPLSTNPDSFKLLVRFGLPRRFSAFNFRTSRTFIYLDASLLLAVLEMASEIDIEKN